MFNKLLAFTQKVADLPDKPSLTPAALKAQFDAAPEELRTYFNDAVDTLNTLESLTSLDLQNSWVNYQVGMEGVYYKDQFGRVFLSGRLKNGVSADGTLVATLPTGYKPVKDNFFKARNCDVLVSADGTVKIYNVTSSTDIGIDGLSFRAQ